MEDEGDGVRSAKPNYPFSVGLATVLHATASLAGAAPQADPYAMPATRPPAGPTATALQPPGAAPQAPTARPGAPPTTTQTLPGQPPAPSPGQPPAPSPGQPAAAQRPYAGQPYAGQPYAGQPYAGQPYAGQPYAGQPYDAGQPYAGQPRPAPPGAAAPPPAAPVAASADDALAKAASVPGMVPGETLESGARTLQGHTFQYPRLLDNAFTAASFYVGSSIEFYQQKEVLDSFHLPDGSTQPFLFDRDLGFIKLNFGVDFHPAEPFTFGLDANYLAEIGANEISLFTHGGHTGFEFRPNLKLRVFRSEASGSQLALRAHANLQRGLGAVPQGLLVELAKEITTIAADPKRAVCLAEAAFDCALGDASSLSDAIQLTRSRNGGGGSIAFAQALGSYLGGQLALGLEGASTTVSTSLTGDVDSSGMLFYAGIAPSLNLHPTLPVGMVFEYRFELDKSSYDANPAAGIAEAVDVTAKSHRLGGGLYYTARRDLMLGWIAGMSFLEDVAHSMELAAEHPQAFVFAAQFDMRYFF